MADAEVAIDEAKLRETTMGQLEVFASGFVSRVATTARDIVPVRSGQLKSLIRAQPVRRVGPWTIESGVESLARHSAPVHEGARPHVIRARNAPALRFFWPKVGRVVFFKRVNHPGNAPQPFLTRAVHRVASADPRITLGER